MPSMTAPLFGPSVMVTSMAFGDFDGSSFWVPTWITLSPILTVCLSPSKMTMNSFNSPGGIAMPPVSLDSMVQVPWNFLTSFSRSALSSARAPDPPDAAKPTAQNSAAREIRIPVLLDMKRTAILLPNAKLSGRLTREKSSKRATAISVAGLVKRLAGRSFWSSGATASVQLLLEPFVPALLELLQVNTQLMGHGGSEARFLTRQDGLNTLSSKRLVHEEEQERPIDVIVLDTNA